MARGKHAAALFEVINRSKPDRATNKSVKEPKERKSKLETPRWWFKSRNGDRDTGGVGPIAPARMAMPVAPRMTESFDIPTTPVNHEPRPSRKDEGKFKLVLPSSQTISFGLMVAAIFGVGFVVGQKFQPRYSPVIAEESTADLIAGSAQPGVLELGDTPGSLTPAKSEELRPATGSNEQPSNGSNAGTAFASASVDSTALLNSHVPTTSIVEESQRVVNFNYVMIQSYPDKDDAIAAIAKLREAGLGASIVQGVSGWRKDWYCVVGTRGFDRIRSNDKYDQYLASIGRVSDKFAGKSKWKKFDPQGYKWRGSEKVID